MKLSNVVADRDFHGAAMYIPSKPRDQRAFKRAAKGRLVRHDHAHACTPLTFQRAMLLRRWCAGVYTASGACLS